MSLNRDIVLVFRARNLASVEMNKISRDLAMVDSDVGRLNNTKMDLGRRMATQGGLIAGALALTVGAAASFEDAFAGVRKTVSDVGTDFDKLEQNIVNLSLKLPVAVEELSNITQIAGQMGITGEANLTKFTKTVAELGITTGIATEELASSIAVISNIMHVPLADVDRLGSAVTELGNRYNGTEQQILNLAVRLAPAANSLNMSTQSMLGLATALSSVGIKAELGGTQISKALYIINQAVLEGGLELEKFAAVSKMSKDDFTAAWKEDPAIALVQFVNELSKAGAEGQLVLKELGIENQLTIRGMQSLAAEPKILASAVKTANEAWQENIATIAEVAERLNTLVSQLGILWNHIKAVAIAWGQDLLPVVKVVVFVLTTLFTILGKIPAPIRMILITFLTLTAAFKLINGLILIYQARMFLLREATAAAAAQQQLLALAQTQAAAATTANIATTSASTTTLASGLIVVGNYTAATATATASTITWTTALSSLNKVMLGLGVIGIVAVLISEFQKIGSSSAPVRDLSEEVFDLGKEADITAKALQEFFDALPQNKNTTLDDVDIKKFKEQLDDMDGASLIKLRDRIIEINKVIKDLNLDPTHPMIEGNEWALIPKDFDKTLAAVEEAIGNTADATDEGSAAQDEFNQFIENGVDILGIYDDSLSSLDTLGFIDQIDAARQALMDFRIELQSTATGFFDLGALAGSRAPQSGGGGSGKSRAEKEADAIRDANRDIEDAFRDKDKAILDAEKDLWDSVADLAREVAKDLLDAEKAYTKEVIKLAKERDKSISKATVDKLKAIGNAYKQLTKDLQATKASLVSTGQGFFQLGNLVEDLADTVDKMQVRTMFEDAGRAAREWIQDLNSLIAKGGSKDLVQMILGLGAQGVPILRGLREATDAEIESLNSLLDFGNDSAVSSFFDPVVNTVTDAYDNLNTTLADIELAFQETLTEINTTWSEGMAEAAVTYNEALAQIDADTKEKLTDIRRTYDEKVAEIGASLEENLSEISRKTAEKIAEIARDIVSGGGRAVSEAGRLANMSLEEFFRESREKLETWATGLQELVERSVDVGIIAELARMGPEAVPLIEEFIGKTDEEIQEINGLFTIPVGSELDALLTTLTIELGKIPGLTEEQIMEAASRFITQWEGINPAVFTEMGKLSNYLITDTTVPNAAKTAGGILSYNYWLGLSGGLPKIAEDTGWWGTYIAMLLSNYNEGAASGRATLDGMNLGLNDRAALDRIMNASRNAGNSVITAINNVLGIFSPSKVSYMQGQFVSIGLANGITSQTSKAVSAAQALSDEVGNAISINPSSNIGGSFFNGLASSHPTSTGPVNFSPGSIQVNVKIDNAREDVKEKVEAGVLSAVRELRHMMEQK